MRHTEDVPKVPQRPEIVVYGKVNLVEHKNCDIPLIPKWNVVDFRGQHKILPMFPNRGDDAPGLRLRASFSIVVESQSILRAMLLCLRLACLPICLAALLAEGMLTREAIIQTLPHEGQGWPIVYLIVDTSHLCVYQ